MHKTIDTDSIICKLCGKECQYLGAHLKAHHLTAREYKELFGLPYDQPLMSREVMQKKQTAFELDREKYLKNLNYKAQFKPGHTGQRRISEKERETIIARIKDVNTRKQTRSACPVCRMQFKHVESHLLHKHRLIYVGGKKEKL